MKQQDQPMRLHVNLPTRPHRIECLEARRLLSFTPIGKETLVPGGDTLHGFFDEFRSALNSVAVARDGQFIVARGTGEASSTQAVMAVRYSASGRLLDELTLASFDHPTFVTDISASMDADGDAVVAYAVNNNVDDTTQLFVVRISRTGVMSPPALIASPPVGFNVSSPNVSMDAAGGYFLGWLMDEDVQMRAYDAAGAPRAAQFTAVPADPGRLFFNDLELAAKPDGSGAVFAVGTMSGGIPTFSGINYGIVTPAGTVDGTSGPIPSNPESDHELEPDIVVNADGSFFVGYTSVPFQSADPPDLTGRAGFVQRVTAAGAIDGEPIALVPAADADDGAFHDIAMAAMPDGGFVASFVQTSGDTDTLYARRFNAAGAADESGLVLLKRAPSQASGVFDFPAPRFAVSVGADANGAAVVAYAQREDRDGDPLTQPDPGPVSFRRLASVAANNKGDLYVFGTESADHITIEHVRGKVFVNVNGAVQPFPAADVVFISANGFGGDDDIDNNTAFAGRINGGDGNDTIWGGVYDDRIRGQGGDDVLRGGNGNDSVLGDSGSDVVHGGDNQDDLIGDTGEDTLVGGSGNDGLHGGRGSDWLYGEADDDVLYGGEAGDYLEGGAGHDLLVGGDGADALFGLAGNDRLHAAGDGLGDTVRGGLGVDSAEVDELDDVLTVESLF